MKRLALIAGAAATIALLGHRWVALAWNASGYPVASPTSRMQVVVSGSHAYFAAGTDGIEVVDLASPPTERRPILISPPAPADRIDDLALADGRLYALDATPPGFLMAYALDSSGLPVSSGRAVSVPVGPFSGVAAAAGLVAVSGGTSRLTLREIASDGSFGTEVATADFGRGQPDLSLRPNGALAAISTHLYGPEFAITFAAIERRPLRLRALGQLRLGEAGFTAGGYKPAHFPMVSVWRGDQLYVAEGGGLRVIDASDPARPRFRSRSRLARPAMDLTLTGDELDVARAGADPGVVRYRLDRSGLPTPIAFWPLPSGRRAGTIARFGSDLLITLHEHGWRSVPAEGFSPHSAFRPAR